MSSLNLGRSSSPPSSDSQEKKAVERPRRRSSFSSIFSRFPLNRSKGKGKGKGNEGGQEKQRVDKEIETVLEKQSDSETASEDGETGSVDSDSLTFVPNLRYPLNSPQLGVGQDGIELETEVMDIRYPLNSPPLGVGQDGNELETEVIGGDGNDGHREGEERSSCVRTMKTNQMDEIKSQMDETYQMQNRMDQTRNQLPNQQNQVKRSSESQENRKGKVDGQGQTQGQGQGREINKLQVVTERSSQTQPSTENYIASNPNPKWLNLPIQEEKLWYVYGKAYDLTTFVKKHPGGQFAIGLGQGRDCTAMFESYHPFVTTHYAILKKYEVTKELANQNQFNLEKSLAKICISHHDESNFDNDGLYATLKQRVKQALEDAGVDSRHPKATTTWWIWYMVVISTFMILYPLYIRGYSFALVGLAFTSWCLTGIGHDGAHFSCSKDATVNFIMSHCIQLIASPLLWYHQHTFAHHSHTNDFDNDPDLHHFKPLRTHPLRKWKPKHIRQYFTPGVWFVWGFGAFGNAFYLPAKMLFTNNISGTTYIPLKLQHYFWQAALYLVYIYFMFLMPSYYLPGSSNAILALIPKTTTIHNVNYTASNYNTLEVNIPTSSSIKYWWPIAYLYLTGLVYGFITQISHIHDLGINASFDKEKNSWAKNQILTSWNYCLGQNHWLYFTY